MQHPNNKKPPIAKVFRAVTEQTLNGWCSHEHQAEDHIGFHMPCGDSEQLPQFSSNGLNLHKYIGRNSKNCNDSYYITQKQQNCVHNLYDAILIIESPPQNGYFL
jgi:hypothetical protein